jgi:hypothetical protein
MGRARKRGRGTDAELLREVKRKLGEGRERLERELARAIHEDGHAMKKPKKIRPVKLKRRQAPLNARARRSVTLADYLAAFSEFGCAGLNYEMANIEVPR